MPYSTIVKNYQAHVLVIIPPCFVSVAVRVYSQPEGGHGADNNI